MCEDETARMINTQLVTEGTTNIKICINDVTMSSSQEHIIAVSASAPSGSALSSSLQWSSEATADADDIDGVVGANDDPGSGQELLHVGPTLWRRNSWLGIDPGDVVCSGGSQKSKIKHSLARTQRSMSLNSLDSDEDTFYDAHDGIAHNSTSLAVALINLDLVNDASKRWTRPRSFSGGLDAAYVHDACLNKHSTSSSDLQAEDEDVDIVRRQSYAGVKLKTPHQDVDNRGLLPPWMSLQKSISTPSILVVKDIAETSIPVDELKARVGADWLYMTSGDSSVCTYPHVNPLLGLHCLAHRRGAVQLNESLRAFTLDSDNDPLLESRKKRGSIFFRKKRGKEKDKENKKGANSGSTSSISSAGVNSHQFVPVCYGNSTPCDVCSKLMANKAALRCENCLVNVHEHLCKDQVSNCSHFRGPIKMSRERPGLTSLKLPPASGGSSPLLISKDIRRHLVGTPLKQTAIASLSPNIPSLSSPSKVINEERDFDTADEFNIIDVYSASMESLDEGTADTNLDDDPELLLLEEEPETWNNAILDKKVLKKLKEKDIKRQENIYEFIITEKHHCLTLRIMQKIFAQGMRRELHMSPDLVERIFPCLQDILDVHVAFLRRLRERQKQDVVIGKIGDLLVEQFQGENAKQLKALYGEFCSRHKGAVSLYKDIFKSDRKFQNFIKKSSLRPLCKARGIPECILLVTQRITKYPLLIDSLIKSSKDHSEEQNHLLQANSLVKDILGSVNAQVAEKEKEQRLLEIYNKIDAKSAAVHKGKKFKKSDLLSSNRKLWYEGPVSLKHARGKVIEVTAVVLSDVIFFLQDNNQKYLFVSQDSKPGVISLQKLLVREKAGQDNRGIYLISSNPNEPEMYEVLCQSSKIKKLFLEAIRMAIECCPEEDGVPGECCEEPNLKEAKSAKLQELTVALHNKDRELALICEDKMRILGDMMELVGHEDTLEPIQYLSLLDDPREGPETRDMLLAAVHEASRLASTLYVTGTSLSRSVSSAGEHQSEAYISPTLPKRAETFGGFDNPNKDLLPKPVNVKKKHSIASKESDSWSSNLSGLLSKTDLQHFNSTSELNQKDESLLSVVKNKEMRRASGPLPAMESISPNDTGKPLLRRSTLASAFLSLPVVGVDDGGQRQGSSSSLDCEKDSSHDYLGLPSPPLVSFGREQLVTTIQLSHYLNTLMCIFSQHFTNVQILRAKLTKAYDEISKLTKESGRRDGSTKDRKNLYRPNQQLEELRNLQEQLTEERTQWQKEREIEEQTLEEKRKELLHLQETLKANKEDVKEQRDHLYRQLEVLQRKGIFFSPNVSMSAISQGSLLESGDRITFTLPTDEVTSPSAHRRSMSCDLQVPGGMKDLGGTERKRADMRSVNASLSPTQAVDISKFPKSDLKSHSTTSLLGAARREQLPMNLYSATNQQKVNRGVPVRQQLPLKLASGVGGPQTASANKSNSFSGITANASSLSQLLSTFPHLQGRRSNVEDTSTAMVTPSMNLPLSQGGQLQSYLHGHAAQWVHSSVGGGRKASDSAVEVLLPDDTLSPAVDSMARSKDRPRKVRDSETNEEIIFF